MYHAFFKTFSRTKASEWLRVIEIRKGIRAQSMS